jgi:hypothetical protein
VASNSGEAKLSARQELVIAGTEAMAAIVAS